MIGCPAFVSLVLVFFGVLFLLENLGVSDGLVGRYWPLILIILGIVTAFNVFRLRTKVNLMRDQFRGRFRGGQPPFFDE